MHIARIYRSVDIDKICPGCSCGPAFLSDFGIGNKFSFFTSSGNCSFSAISLYISAISLLI